LDILKGLNKTRLEVLVAYKPDFPGLENDLVSEIEILEYRMFSLSGCYLF
jgi:hypothetical protein